MSPRIADKGMPEHVVIHTGMPKTATTFLQTELFPNIPDALYYGKDHELWSLLFHLPFTHPHFTDVAALKRKVAALWAKHSQRTLLISHESLSGHPLFNFENHESDASTLKALFPDAKIVFTVRRQDEFIESLYSHTILLGYSQPLDDFLNWRDDGFGNYRYNTGCNIEVARLDYDYYVRVYEEMFGRENVLVLPFELMVKDRAAFLQRFFAFTGCQSCEPDWELHRNRGALVANRSPTQRTLRLARRLNPFFRSPISNGYGFIPHSLLLRALYRLDSIIGRKGRWLDPERSRRILEMHAASNEALDRRHNLGLADYGYYAARAAKAAA